MADALEPSPRRLPQQWRARQTVEAVLQAVPIVLQRYGSAAVTTNRIAEVAGISIGSLYQYFPNKQAIFAALHERHAEEVGGILQRSVAGSALPSLGELAREVVATLADLHATQAELHQIVASSVAGDSTGFAAALRETFAPALVPDACLDTKLMCAALPNVVEGLVHGVARNIAHDPQPPGAAKDAALRRLVAYLAQVGN